MPAPGGVGQRGVSGPPPPGSPPPTLRNLSTPFGGGALDGHATMHVRPLRGTARTASRSCGPSVGVIDSEGGDVHLEPRIWRDQPQTVVELLAILWDELELDGPMSE